MLDDPEIEKIYIGILRRVQKFKNGDVAASMREKGILYKVNLGVSVLDMREISREYSANHLLALKLWNKNWRETRILATMLDEPDLVTEEQMDFWTKSFDNTEIAEHTVANLWVKTRYAFIKALEWCRGKKHIVRFTGLQLIGRLAMVDKSAIDEMFEPFFEELAPLAKDPKLNIVFYRSFNLLGSRSKHLNTMAVEFAKKLKSGESANAKKLAGSILEELTSEDVAQKLKGAE